MRRVVVIGCAGSGKTWLARELAVRTGLRHYERDGLGPLGSPQYRSALTSMLRTDSWLLDGAPYFMEDQVYPRADTVVALDYRKSLVLRRALWRTLRVELGRHPDGAHGRLGARALVRNPDHPLRWAWSSHSERSQEARELNLRPELASATVFRFTTPASAEAWLSRLP